MPEWITGEELDDEYRQELRGLTRENAERVARHLVAALVMIEEDPRQALSHASFAVGIGARVGIVRETCGVIAYQCGDYKLAVRELRTALRITGSPEVLPMLADAERGLGRPERAFEIAASREAEGLDDVGTIEMMIVVAGAYADTGDLQTAISSLEIPALRQKVAGRWQVRLWVAYSDLLTQAGRSEEAQKWLRLAADADTERLTDAADRLGRAAPVEPTNPTWYDAEELHVVDAYDESLAEEDAAESTEDPSSSETDPADEVHGSTEGSEDSEEPEAPETPDVTDDQTEVASGASEPRRDQA